MQLWEEAPPGDWFSFCEVIPWLPPASTDIWDLRCLHGVIHRYYFRGLCPFLFSLPRQNFACTDSEIAEIPGGDNLPFLDEYPV